MNPNPMNPNPKLILLGGGGHCKSCIEVIEAEGNFTIAGILDATDKVGQDIYWEDKTLPLQN